MPTEKPLFSSESSIAVARLGRLCAVPLRYLSEVLFRFGAICRGGWRSSIETAKLAPADAGLRHDASWGSSRAQRALTAVVVLAFTSTQPALAVTAESRQHAVKGIELYNQGKIEAAIAEFRKAVELDPTNADYHNNLSAVLQSQGKTAEALKEAQLAAKYRPNSATTQANLGNMLQAMKNYAEAEKHYRQAVKLSAKNLEYRSNLALNLSAQKKYADAEKEYREILKVKPKDVATVVKIADLLREQKAYDRAEKEARSAVQLDAKNADAHLTLAMVLKDEKKDAEAIKEFETTLKLKPDHPSRQFINQYIDYLKNRRI